MFLVTCYLRPWFTAMVPSVAPRMDLQFIRAALGHAAINRKVSDIALQKFAGHLRYLTQEMVALALFDEDVPKETKKLMVMALEVSQLFFSLCLQK